MDNKSEKVLIFSNRNCDRYVLGCQMVKISADVNDSLEDLSEYDGLIIVGGGDINPKRYGQKNVCSKNIDDDFDEKNIKCLDYFVKHKKPVLGICKGIQLINVYFGGTLKQDISNHNFPTKMHVHDVKFCTKCSLKDYYGKVLKVNSLHHQCIDKLGDGLTIVAISKDGVIEAVQKENILAVQWHPERLLGNDFDTIEGVKVFEAFRDLLLKSK